MSKYEHKSITHPGKARFYSMPNIDHSSVRVQDLQHAIDIRNDWSYISRNFNEGLVTVVHQWMQEIIQK